MQLYINSIRRITVSFFFFFSFSQIIFTVVLVIDLISFVYLPINAINVELISETVRI